MANFNRDCTVKARSGVGVRSRVEERREQALTGQVEAVGDEAVVLRECGEDLVQQDLKHSTARVTKTQAVASSRSSVHNHQAGEFLGDD